jgi:hypothetical protein
MITFNITYYNEPEHLQKWYETAERTLDRGLPILYSICDDGSKIAPATDFFEKRPPLPGMRLYRVKEDLGFNSHGCRNLLMKQTTTDWNLLSDIDRLYKMDTIEGMVETQGQDPGEYYVFSTKYGPSVNDIFVHRVDFWKTYGYDEEFTNIHWGDRMMLDVLKREAQRVVRDDWIMVHTRWAREVSWTDVERTEYPDDKTLIHPVGFWGDEEKRLALKRHVRERNANVETRKLKSIINFEWEQVF